MEDAKKDYTKAYKEKGIVNPDVEMDNLKSALSNIGSQLREARQQQAKLAADIEWVKKKRDNPDADDRSIDDEMIQKFTTGIVALQNKMADEQIIQEAQDRGREPPGPGRPAWAAASARGPSRRRNSTSW